MNIRDGFKSVHAGEARMLHEAFGLSAQSGGRRLFADMQIEESAAVEDDALSVIVRMDQTSREFIATGYALMLIETFSGTGVRRVLRLSDRGELLVTRQTFSNRSDSKDIPQVERLSDEEVIIAQTRIEGIGDRIIPLVRELLGPTKLCANPSFDSGADDGGPKPVNVIEIIRKFGPLKNSKPSI